MYYLLKVEYLYKFFGIPLHGRFVSSSLFIHSFVHSLLHTLWIYGYLCYILIYNPILCCLVAQFVTI